MSGSDEKLPISETYKVVEFVTIFKTSKWWEAVVAQRISRKALNRLLSVGKKKRRMEEKEQVQLQKLG